MVPRELREQSKRDEGMRREKGGRAVVRDRVATRAQMERLQCIHRQNKRIYHEHKKPEAVWVLLFFSSAPSNPTIYLFFAFIPTAPSHYHSYSSSSPVGQWHAGYSMAVLLWISRMLLPSGGIPSAFHYAVRSRPQEGMGKWLWAKRTTHTIT